MLLVPLALALAACQGKIPACPASSLASALTKAPRNGAQMGGMLLDANGVSEGAGAPGAAADGGYGLIRIYVVLDYPGAGLSGSLSSALSSTLAEVQSTGVLQAFLRFYYADGVTSKSNAASTVSAIASDIAQAKGVVSGYVGVIPFIQAGFLGPWGEWWGGDLEGGDFGSDSDLSTLKTGVVDALKQAFPHTFIHLRMPRDIATYYPDDPQIAFHDDSVLAGDDDGGTFNANKKTLLWPDGDPAKQRAWIKERNARLGSTNSGEASENTPALGCDTLLAYLDEYDIRVFNAQWPSVVTPCDSELKAQLKWQGALEPGAASTPPPDAGSGTAGTSGSGGMPSAAGGVTSTGGVTTSVGGSAGSSPAPASGGTPALPAGGSSPIAKQSESEEEGCP